MHATSLSPGVLRMVGLAASDFSFAAASDLLWELAAVRVGTKQVERCAEALGREVADDERAVAETVPSSAPTMYLGQDGSGVPVRPAEVEGRRGKQPDGSAKTREVKLATVWTAEGHDKADRPVRDLGSVSYNAAVESAASRDTAPRVGAPRGFSHPRSAGTVRSANVELAWAARGVSSTACGSGPEPTCSRRRNWPVVVYPRSNFTLAAHGRRLAETPDFRGDCGQQCRNATGIELQTCSSDTPVAETCSRRGPWTSGSRPSAAC